MLKRPFIPLLLILLLAYGLRIIHLDAYSFWTDEGLTPLRSGYPISEILSNRITIQDGVGRDTHPPLYYLVVHFTQQGFGQSDFAYRYPSLLANVLLVGLMYQLGRRLQDKQVGTLAALLTAVNPLQIYYSTEARMYTLFVLLAAATTYVLWRALSGRNLYRSLVLYLVLAGLTIYTHYTAVFLIAAQGLFWLWLLWQNGQKKLIIGMFVAGILLAIPLIPYTIPRLFTGPEANYFYVQPGVMLQDTLHAFNLGVTIGDPWGWPAGLFNITTLVLLGVAFWHMRQSWQKSTLLFTYLLAIVFGLMVGSLLKPMYQGVRHSMGGSPAMLLLLAIGFVALVRQLAVNSQQWGRRTLLFTVYCSLFTLLLVGPLTSLNNLYNSPEYVKDDYRQMITYVEQQAGDNDVFVYNDAILLPLHEHYRTRTDLVVTAHPVYPYHAANVEVPLQELAQQYERIWFMADPPNDKRDDDHLIQGWLDAELTMMDKRWFPARTTEIVTIGYGTKPIEAENLPANGRSVQHSWPQFPQLHGIALTTETPVAQPTLWFDLFWTGELANEFANESATLRFTLRGPDGNDWLIQEQPIVRPETAVWPSTNNLIRRSYSLSLPEGFPPGDYTLLAQPLDQNNGAALAEAESLLEIPIAASHTWPFAEKRPFFAAPDLTFANGLTLDRLQIFDSEVRPGHNLPFALYWQPTTDLNSENLRYILEVIGPDGEVVREQGNQPGASWLAAWPAQTLVQQRDGIYFRPETESGTYRLRWRLEQAGEIVTGQENGRLWQSETMWLGEVEVVPWPLETELPPVANPRPAAFGDIIQLHGYDVTDLTRDSLDLTLYWETTAVPPANYLLFVHLVSASEGEIVSQADVVPVSGLRPTRSWRQGEILTDRHQLTLPSDYASGDYYLNIGFYLPDTFERLPITVDGVPQPHNQLQLTTLKLP
ncbi:MAG: glycosyltransferase family 39 protein [Chloroflexota bacterium]